MLRGLCEIYRDYIDHVIWEIFGLIIKIVKMNNNNNSYLHNFENIMKFFMLLDDMM